MDWILRPAIQVSRKEVCAAMADNVEGSGHLNTGGNNSCLHAVLGKPRVVMRGNMPVIFKFADGSIGTLHYFASGHKSYPKETFELFCDGKILRLDNFRKLRGYGWSNFKKMNLWAQDKGHSAEFRHFIESITGGGEPLISFEEIENVTLATLAAVESAETAEVITI